MVEIDEKGLCMVKNVHPKTARFAVAQAWYGELWYYGSWDTRSEAEKAAKEIGERAVVIDFTGED